LLDVVETDGLASDMKRLLGKVVLGDAPAVGEKRVYSTRVIADSLRKNINKKFVGVQIPNQVIVANRGYEIDADAIRSELIARWKKFCDECRFEFQNFKMPVVPADLQGYPWRIESNTNFPKGSFSEKIWIERGNNDRQLFWVTGQIQIQRKVPVAARALVPGTKLRATDFNWQWRDTTFATDGVLEEGALNGQEVRYALVSGDIIWSRAVQREKAVRRGDLVKVFVGEGNWQVTLMARTQQDGYIGDIVTVKNIQTQKLISGEVVGQNEVALK
jgi:flagella basal body P-ring formation protein FlgA